MPIVLREREGSSHLLENISTCLKECGVDQVELNDNSSVLLSQKPIYVYLELLLSELTDNCMEKGAKKVIVSLNDNSLRVEDDVVESDPQKTLKFLNNLLHCREEEYQSGCKENGGVGIARIVTGILQKIDGKIEYSVTEGRIVAEVSWH